MPFMNKPMIRATDLHKHFGQLEVLKGVTFEVASGESGRLAMTSS